MGRRDGATFVFLATGTFAGEEIRKCTFDASALDGLVNVETDVIFGGKFDGFLIVIDADLRVMIFFAAVDGDLAAGITGFDIMNAVSCVIIIGGFELFLVIIDETDGLVVTN